MKLLSLHSPAPFLVGLLADSVNDASSTRKVYLLAAGLAALGITLLVITVWFWRSTRPDPALLAPLEVMGDRKFRNLDGVAQHELLNSVRPEDAQPLRWGVVEGQPLSGGVIDLEAAARAELKGFADLRDDDVDDVAEAEAPVVEVAVDEAPVVEVAEVAVAEVAVVEVAVVESPVVIDFALDDHEPDLVLEPLPEPMPEPMPEPLPDPSTPLARDLMDPLLRNAKKGHH